MTIRFEPLPDTLQTYASLAEYAAIQGAPASAFIAAGYCPAPEMKTDSEGESRPALKFITPGGMRWRFIDGLKGRQKYTSRPGYTLCWYGLDRAIHMAKRTGQPLIICNGEASVIVAQYHGLAAACIAGAGEKPSLPPRLLSQLQARGYSGRILVAYDCDPTGRKNAPQLAAQLASAGYNARAIDLELTEKGDIANFCKIHGSDAARRIAACPHLPEPLKPAPRPIHPETPAHLPPGDSVDWQAERRLWWIDEVLPALENAITHRKGKHFLCLNPDHREEHPSARISTDRYPDGVYVCTCGVHSRDAVSSWLGLPGFIEWWKERRRPALPGRQLLPPPSEAPAGEPPRPYFPDGAPDTWTAAAIRTGINAAVFHLLYASAGARKSHRWTFDELMDENLKHGYGIAKRRLYEFLQLFDTHIVRILPEDSGGLPGKKRIGGLAFELLPPAEVQSYLLLCLSIALNMEYHPATDAHAVLATPTARMMEAIQEPEDTAQALTALCTSLFDELEDERGTAASRRDAEMRYWQQALDDLTHTPLPAGQPKHNPASVTRAFAAVKVPTGIMIRQSTIARMLGVSSRSVRTILKEVGFKGTPPDIAPQQIASVAEAKAFARAHSAKLMRLVSYAPDQAAAWYSYENDAGAAAFMESQTRRGACVFAEIRPPNLYERVAVTSGEIGTGTPRPPAPPRASDRQEADQALPRCPHQYDPRWVLAQLKLILSLLEPEQWEWRESNLIDTTSGEIHRSPTAQRLIALILKRPIPPELEDSLIHFARFELGAVITEMDNRRRG